jgi:hypothetical protein
MKCVFCKGEIDRYILVNLDIITSAEHKPFPMLTTYGASTYTGTVRAVALLECPHCDMAFFMKPQSGLLKNMSLVVPEQIGSASSPSGPDIKNMTPEEKEELYKKMSKELISRYS